MGQMIRTAVRSDEFRRWAQFLFGFAVVLVCLHADTAYAQVSTERFFGPARELVRSIINDPIWGIALAGVVVFEVVLFGITKNKLHLIGIVIPGLCLAAWASRQEFINSFADGIGL